MSTRWDRESPGDWPVIALIASKGGLDALLRVLGALGEPVDAVLLVLVHQAPDRVSRLAEILDGRSALPVAEAEHGVPLEPGRVIVVPPGRHLLIAPGLETVLVRSGAVPPSRPSADLLLATLATAAGARAVAVVLSGGGHDGATGASVIHALGGTVVATDEASSETFGMPSAAIARDDAVHVLDLDDVAGFLASIVQAPRR